MDPLQQINLVTREAKEKLCSLSPSQLNWKPDPKKWSIAQCLDHIMVSNKTYYPTFEKLLTHSYRLPLLQRLNPFKKLFGPMMVKSLGPQPTKKFTAPKIFEPSSSDLPGSMVSNFVQHQAILGNYVERLNRLDTKKEVITSPVSGLISYSLEDAMRIISGHEQRHLNQALDILHHPNFPPS